MIRQVKECDDAKNEIILYKLKSGKKSPFCNPYYYDKNILDEFYVAHKISAFPRVLCTRLLGEFESYDYRDFIKNKLIHEVPSWVLFGNAYITERQENWEVPEIEESPKFLAIRPVLVIENQSLDGIELAGGDLIFCSKLFNDTYEPEKVFQHIAYFSVLSDNILLFDKQIGKIQFAPILSNSSWSRIEEMINRWYMNFIDYFDYYNTNP